MKGIMLLTGKPSILKLVHPLLTTDKDFFTFVLSNSRDNWERPFCFFELKDNLRLSLVKDENALKEIEARKEDIQNDISILRNLFVDTGKHHEKTSIANYLVIKENNYVPLETIKHFEDDLRNNPLPREFYFNQLDEVAQRFKNIARNNLRVEGNPVETASYIFQYLDDKDIDELKTKYPFEEYSNFYGLVTQEQTRRLQTVQAQPEIDTSKRKFRKQTM